MGSRYSAGIPDQVQARCLVRHRVSLRFLQSNTNCLPDTSPNPLTPSPISLNGRDTRFSFANK